MFILKKYESHSNNAKLTNDIYFIYQRGVSSVHNTGGNNDLKI